MNSNECMFRLPPELTGFSVSICGLIKDGICNKGRNCVAFKRHTDESRKALADAIEAKNAMEKSK